MAAAADQGAEPSDMTEHGLQLTADELQCQRFQQKGRHRFARWILHEVISDQADVTNTTAATMPSAAIPARKTITSKTDFGR